MLTIVAASLGGACSSNGDSDASDAAVDAYVDGGRIAQGAVLVIKKGCDGCHNPPDPATQGLFSGSLTPRPGTNAYPANLTPDVETGLGSWTDDQVFRAITLGIDKNDVPLCFTMPRFNFDTDEIYSMILYLKSLPPIHRQIPTSTCPPLKPRPDAGEADAEIDSARAADAADDAD
jgi:hypothetical protein